MATYRPMTLAHIATTGLIIESRARPRRVLSAGICLIGNVVIWDMSKEKRCLIGTKTYTTHMQLQLVNRYVDQEGGVVDEEFKGAR